MALFLDSLANPHVRADALHTLDRAIDGNDDEAFAAWARRYGRALIEVAEDAEAWRELGDF